MNPIVNAASTATTNVTTNVFTRGLNFVWEHTAGYLINFDHNYETLKEKAVDLKSLRDYVMTQIERDEANQLTRIPMVDDWVRRVDESLLEVDTILQHASQQSELGCIPYCSFKYCWRCYKLGKQLSLKLETVNGFLSRKFDVVADRSSPIQVRVVPENPTIGMDALFEEVWSLLGQDEVKIMGIYGMGGVGKTTLLKKINNSFFQVVQKNLVILVVVSREFSLQRVQNEIGKRLGLVWSEGDDQNEKRDRIFNALMKRKFVVLLDDLWQPIALDDVGIPSPYSSNHSHKVLFTTRSEGVCRAMDANKMVKVSLLDWDHAWTLFQHKLRREDIKSGSELLELAEEIAKECNGLPLALLTVASTMATKKTAPEWRHAINTLKRYAAEFSGMEEKVLAPLKFSYDSLENDTVRKCLLYFSLYNEAQVIIRDEIVEHWIGEGFLGESHDLDDARLEGLDIIGRLHAACLLESSKFTSCIKMHDVVRDMALWIAREVGKKENKSSMHVVVGLTQTPNLERWKDAERVSIINKDITELPKPPESPCLLTLLLQGNEILSSITPNFFKYMPLLRVLNLSNTRIREIPKSIGHLVELQFLDLSFTRIEALPEELANLTKLQLLNLRCTFRLEKIPRGVIPQLLRLQSLNISDSEYVCHPSVFEELEQLEHLGELRITVQDFLGFSPKLRSCLKGICISGSKALTHFQLAPSLFWGNLEGLTEIKFENCLELEELKIDCVKTALNKKELLFTLEKLRLVFLPKLNIVCTAGTAIHGYFKKLHYVTITDCHALKEISWLSLVPFLRFLYIHDCEQIEQILADEWLARPWVENQSIFSRLEDLTLIGLPKLQSISRVDLPFPSLGSLCVSRCPLLKKLPLTSNSSRKSSLEIKGATEWWNELEWEDETIKTSLQFSILPEHFLGSKDSESDGYESEGSESDGYESEGGVSEGTMAGDAIQTSDPVFSAFGRQVNSGQPSTFNLSGNSS